MPVVVQADPPLHCGPAGIGSSSRLPDSSTPPGPGSPSRCSEPSSSLKIDLEGLTQCQRRVSRPVIVGRSKIRLMTLFVGSSGGIASFSPRRRWPPHNVFLPMVPWFGSLSHMPLAESGSVQLADVLPTATHYAFLMVPVIWMIDC
ncbi:hypothetical protein Nepgr_002627 [Nepenthes gracilis]|uniref:Uncharacterized protein n=1 Tax=Nepenthes gracilis TaxID=150966 RepID=A0AAD3P915_NEPGR|nr:hypothetical protein Nepgr_002627 [Nepenthes gracilis]